MSNLRKQVIGLVANLRASLLGDTLVSIAEGVNNQHFANKDLAQLEANIGLCFDNNPETDPDRLEDEIAQRFGYESIDQALENFNEYVGYAQRDTEARCRLAQALGCVALWDDIEARVADLLKPMSQNSWDHFHDVVFDAIGQDLNREQFEILFAKLPSWLQGQARHLGMDDTPWRDRAYTWLKENNPLA